jgi:hypothetical protein
MGNTNLTLQQLSHAGPFFRRLLRYLGEPEEGWHPKRLVSLGDFVMANGVAGGWRYIRFLDWDDISVRRQVIGALLQTFRRINASANIITELARWCAGEEVDLWRLSDKAVAVARWEDTQQKNALDPAKWRSGEAGWALVAVIDAAKSIRWRDAGKIAEASWKAAAVLERSNQARDLIEGFPPLIGPVYAAEGARARRHQAQN